MSVRRRPDDQGGGWEIDIGVRGRRHRRTVKGSFTRRQVEALERDWRHALEAGRDPFARADGRGEPAGPQRPPLQTWLDLAGRWWERRGQHQASAATVRGHLERLADAIGDATPLDLIRTASFEAVVERWRVEPRRWRFRDGRGKAGPPVGPETINARLRIARAIWTRARSTWSEDCPPLAPIAWRDVLVVEKDPDPLAHYLPPAVRGPVLAALEATAPHARLALEIAEETGLRLGSVLSLDWSRIDLEAGVYRVLGKGRGGGRWLVKPITGRLRAILEAAGPRASGPVVAYAGRPVKSIRTAVQAARRRAGVPGFAAKHLRHSTAIEILASGGDLADAQAVLDHADPGITHRHYGRLDLERVRAAMERRHVAMTPRTRKSRP